MSELTIFVNVSWPTNDTGSFHYYTLLQNNLKEKYLTEELLSIIAHTN